MNTFWSIAGKVSSAAISVSNEISSLAEEAISHTSKLPLREDTTSSPTIPPTSSSPTTKYINKSKQFLTQIVSTITPHIQEFPSLVYATLFENDRHIWRINHRLYIMGYPHADVIEQLSTYFDEIHSNHYLIFNMSEKSINHFEYFNNGCINDIHFKGLPAPPLLLQLQLCMEAWTWLKNDMQNVLIVNCYSGFGRSVIFLSCFMAWCGMSDHPLTALNELCMKVDLSDNYLGHIIPSQRRYIGYFDSILSGYSPSFQKLSVKKLILKGTPQPRIPIDSYIDHPESPFQSTAAASTTYTTIYVEVWQGGVMIYSSDSEENVNKIEGDGGASIHQNEVVDDEVAINLTVSLYGDVLFRLRGIDNFKSHSTILRAAFHTGFITDNFLLYKKHELDGAAVDADFPDNAHLIIIFEDDGTLEASQVAKELRIIEDAREGSRDAKNALRLHQHYMAYSEEVEGQPFEDTKQTSNNQEAESNAASNHVIEVSTSSCADGMEVKELTEENEAPPPLITIPEDEVLIATIDEEKKMMSTNINEKNVIVDEDEEEVMDNSGVELLSSIAKNQIYSFNVDNEEELDEFEIGWDAENEAVPTLQQWKLPDDKKE